MWTQALRSTNGTCDIRFWVINIWIAFVMWYAGRHQHHLSHHSSRGVFPNVLPQRDSFLLQCTTRLFKMIEYVCIAYSQLDSLELDVDTSTKIVIEWMYDFFLYSPYTQMCKLLVLNQVDSSTFTVSSRTLFQFIWTRTAYFSNLGQILQDYVWPWYPFPSDAILNVLRENSNTKYLQIA